MIRVSTKYACTRLLASVSVGAIVLATMSHPAKAQQAAQDQTQTAVSADPNAGIEEVTVTARKRSEKLLDVPIAVTAFTAANIQAQGITSLSDIAQSTPGLTLDGTVAGSGRNDRSFPEYIIRGMVPSSQQNPTTTVFLDGAPVPSGQIDSVDDVERVEILKGPQSAYFGRETFAGAINVVTKDPSDTFGGSVSGLVGSRNYTDFRATVEGPIIPGVLDGRLTLRNYSRDGSYGNQASLKANSDETLGDQSTKSASAALVFKPIDNLKIKFDGIIWNDDDGPSAQALILTNQSNCTFSNGVKYFCGTAPGRLSSTPAANTQVDSAIKQFLSNTNGEDNYILFNPSDQLDHYGLDRKAYHVSLGEEYAVPSLGFTVSSLTAVDKQTYVTLQDLDNADTSSIPTFFGAQTYFNWPFLVENRYRNISQDLRITSDSDQRFRWTLGGSYNWFRTDQSLTSGGPFGVAGFLSGSNEAETIGGYYALAYDIFSDLTLTFEGRYQTDKQTAYNGNSNSINTAATYRDFLPRASLQYKFTPDVMAYATYSEGVNPGTFNTGLESLTPAQQAAAASQLGATVEVKPEHLKNYELGVKGNFFDHKLTVTADIYYDKWSDQIFLGEFSTFGSNGLVNLQTVQNNANSSTLKGIEIDATARPIPKVLINVSGAINDSRITSGSCGTCAELDGSTYMIGKQLPNVSKYQAAVGIQYTDTVEMMPDWSWFSRADYSYKSGAYDLPANFVKTPDSNIVNLRAGVQSDAIRVEVFVDNVTNEDAYTNLASTALLASPASNFSTPNTLVAGLPNLRTYGVRATYRFNVAESEPPAPAPAPLPPAPPPPAPAAPPAPAPEPQRAYQVFFDFDKSDIKTDAASVIAQAAEAVKAGHQTQINVTGHTDTVGSARYNLKLSMRRADAVKKQLIADGVTADEIATSGVGKTGLLVPTPDGVREPQNRRAEIVLH